VHPTMASGTVSFLYRNGAFVHPVCVHLAARIGAGPSHCELIRLLECGVEQSGRLVLWSKGFHVPETPALGFQRQSLEHTRLCWASPCRGLVDMPCSSQG
jgi:hypothetical protein